MKSGGSVGVRIHGADLLVGCGHAVETSCETHNAREEQRASERGFEEWMHPVAMESVRSLPRARITLPWRFRGVTCSRSRVQKRSN